MWKLEEKLYSPNKMLDIHTEMMLFTSCCFLSNKYLSLIWILTRPLLFIYEIPIIFFLFKMGTTDKCLIEANVIWLRIFQMKLYFQLWRIAIRRNDDTRDTQFRRIHRSSFSADDQIRLEPGQRFIRTTCFRTKIFWYQSWNSISGRVNMLWLIN